MKAWTPASAPPNVPDTTGDVIRGGQVVGFDTVALRFLRERQALGTYRPESARTRWYVYARFSDFVNDITPGRVTRRHVDRYLLERARTLSPSGLRHELSALRAFFAWATVQNVCRKDPTAGIQGPRGVRTNPRGFSADEVTKVLLAAPDVRAQVVILFMVQECLRRGEVARLTVGAIDFGVGVALIIGKGGHERLVPISVETMDTLRAYLANYPAGGDSPLIRSYTVPGQGLSGSRLYRIVRGALDDSGVKERAWDGRSCHAFRHAGAQGMVEHGADVTEIQQLLGHRSLTATTIYLRRSLATSRLRAAAGGRAYLPGATLGAGPAGAPGTGDSDSFGTPAGT